MKKQWITRALIGLTGFGITLLASMQWVYAEKVNIGVIEFENTGASQMGLSFARKTHALLQRKGEWRVGDAVYPRDGDQNMQIWRLREEGIDQVIVGSVGRFRNTIIVDLKVIDAESLAVLHSTSASGAVEEMERIVERLLLFEDASETPQKAATPVAIVREQALEPTATTPANVTQPNVTQPIEQVEQTSDQTAPVDDQIQAPVIAQDTSVATETDVQPVLQQTDERAIVPIEQVNTSKIPPEEPEVERWPLTVLVTPRQSRIRVMNIKPKYQPQMLLKPGSYLIDVTRPGYQNHREWVRMREKERTLVVKLIKK